MAEEIGQQDRLLGRAVVIGAAVGLCGMPAMAQTARDIRGQR